MAWAQNGVHANFSFFFPFVYSPGPQNKYGTGEKAQDDFVAIPAYVVVLREPE